MEKFIIALLALSPDVFVNYAQKYFSSVSDHYILHTQESRPHITLAQFYGHEDDLMAVKNYFEQLKGYPYTIRPNLKAVSFKKDRHHDQIWWVEISITREVEMVSLQKEVDNFLSQRNIDLINANRDLFDPHLTFARIKTDTLNLDLKHVPLEGLFRLAIGKTDEYGQLVELIKVF